MTRVRNGGSAGLRRAACLWAGATLMLAGCGVVQTGGRGEERDAGAARRARDGGETLVAGEVAREGAAGRSPFPDFDPPALYFRYHVSAMAVEIRNAGAGTMEYEITPRASWVTASPSSGECRDETDVIQVTLNRAWISPGETETVIDVQAGGVNHEFPITLESPEEYTMEEFPFFQYLIEKRQTDIVNETNWHVMMRPFVSNLWSTINEAPGYIAYYRGAVPGAQIGRYYSCVFASPAPPAWALPKYLPNVPDEWLLRFADGRLYIVYQAGENRTCVDLTIPAARSAMIDFWYNASAGWDMVLIDHFIYKYSALFSDCAHGKAAWDAALFALVQEYRARYSKPLLLNTITRPEQTWAELTPYVDGFFYESALGASVYFPQTDWRDYYFKGELAAYRAALDAGKTVMICNNNTWAGVYNDAELSEPQVVGPLLSAVVCLLRNPGEPFYYNTNINLNHNYAPQPWHSWWHELGSPAGVATWNGLRIRRDFARGSVEMDITAAKPIVTISIGGIQTIWGTDVQPDVNGYIPGDTNCDKHVDYFDIEPFLLAISDPAEYDLRYPACDLITADVNGDGSANVFDLRPFADLLTGP